jgi:NADPH:quinone reductase-like Zn-dependent oxidoreductase
MILGNDGVGALDDGTQVVIYPMMGSDDWRDDETLDPHWHVFNEKLPRKVQAVIDNVGPATWPCSIASVARGGTIVITGGTTGFEMMLPLLPMLREQFTVRGSIMGTLQEMKVS